MSLVWVQHMLLPWTPEDPPEDQLYWNIAASSLLAGQVVAVVVVVARDDLSNDPSADTGSPHHNNYLGEAIKNYTAIKLIQFQE